MKLSEMKPKKRKILIYGKAGVGKTALLMTLGERLQMLDLDDGVYTGVKLEDEWKSERMKVDILQCLETKHDKATAFAAAKDALIKIANKCNASPCQQATPPGTKLIDMPKLPDTGAYDYDYLGIDTYTGLADAAVRYVLSNSGILGKAPKIQHWGLAFIELEGFLTILRSLPLTVFLICHEQTSIVDEETKVELATPGQKLQAKIPRYFDEIWYMKVMHKAQNKRARVLQTQPTPSILARTRSSLEDGLDTCIGMKAILEKL